MLQKIFQIILHRISFKSPFKIYVRLLATKTEKRNKAEDRTHRQRQTDTLVHKTNLQCYPKN